jgi:hypothetical protein
VRSHVPPGTDQIVAMVDDLLASYPSSLTFPQICDLILFGVFTKRKEARGWLRRIFPQSDLPVRVEAVRKFIGALVAMGACPGYVLDAVVTAGKPTGPEVKPKPPEAAPPAPVAEEAKLETSITAPEGAVTKEPAAAKPESEPKQEDLDLSEGGTKMS